MYDGGMADVLPTPVPAVTVPVTGICDTGIEHYPCIFVNIPISSFYSRVALVILDRVARRANSIWLLAVVVWWTSMMSQQVF